MQLQDKKFTLRTCRMLSGMTQKAAAKALGITSNTLSCYERSLGYPDVALLKRMEQLYGIPYDRMLFPELQ